MKATIALLMLAISLSAFAQSRPHPRPRPRPQHPPRGVVLNPFDASAALTLYSYTLATTAELQPKQFAESALKDVQNLEAGVLSPALGQYIKSTLERHPDQSVADAIDSLITEAQAILAE